VSNKRATISWFPVSDEATWPDDLAALGARFKAEMGFVPNMLRGYAWRPDRCRAWFLHFRQLHQPTEGLSAAEREMIAVVVSMVNRCAYCLVSHGAALRDELGDPVLAERIALDYRRAGLDDRRRAILDYAAKVTSSPTSCDESDVLRLRELGLSQEEVWDVVELAAMYNFTNRLTMAAGLVPNAEDHYRARSQPL
jgi:uncharacterized peroxidase-related enzyme